MIDNFKYHIYDQGGCVELDLLLTELYFIFGIYFIFRSKFSWNERIDKCMLLGRNFDFLGGYLVVTACYLVVTACYCLLPGG